MGLSSLAVVTGIIQEIYDITFRTNQLYQEKFYLSKLGREIGMASAKAAGQPDGAVGSVRELIVIPGQRPFYSQVQKEPDLEPGAGRMQKEAAEKMFEAYLRDIHSLESIIDQELEQLKAKRTALQSEKDEFVKYIAENIKNTFKNNYMG